MEDSFDESMFLPNVQSVKEEEKENVNAFTPSKENTPFTPSKLDDYGVKRQPLSERKQNRTPLSVRSTNKKMRPSSKKLMSSTKNRSHYMMFNNKNLFGNK